MRQLMLYEPQISTPARMKGALDDPVLLQQYVLDANVVKATKELMTVAPKTDVRGQPVLSVASGKRRVDYLLYRNRNNAGQLPVVSIAFDRRPLFNLS